MVIVANNLQVCSMLCIAHSMQQVQPDHQRTHTGDTSTMHARRLRAAHLRATPQRLAVLDVLARAHKPLALHDVGARLGEGVANQSTLYRAMHDLCDAGIARSVDLRHAHAHYELVTDTEHHHLICTSCGAVEDYSSPLCRKIEADALKQSTSFATISEHAFELYGTCKRCAAA